MSDLKSFSFLDKFTGDNFREHKFSLSTLARMLSSMGILDGSEEIPTSPPEKVKDYNKRRDTLQGAIVFSQSQQTSKHVRNAKPEGCPRSAYLALAATYESTTNAATPQPALIRQIRGAFPDMGLGVHTSFDPHSMLFPTTCSSPRHPTV